MERLLFRFGMANGLDIMGGGECDMQISHGSEILIGKSFEVLIW